MRERILKINCEAEVSAIYGDDLAGLIEQAETVSITRASHVEPTTDGQWTADLSPVGGPVLGPFALRQTALDEEVAWLKQNLFSVQ